MIDIPDLLEVVKDWYREVRSCLPSESLWFAAVSPETRDVISKIEAGSQCHTRARKDLKDWLKRVGLPYHSPHKFRHGHAVYALKREKDVPTLKAVSYKLMNS